MEFDVLVEVPKGSRNKYEMDHESGRLRLDRRLFTSVSYPADYGFVPETLAEDGDPLDVLVLLEEPTFPGCLIACRAVGVIHMRDEKGADEKILAVPVSDPRSTWRDLEDVPEYLLLEISHFFKIYKDLEPGKETEVLGSGDRADAEGVIDRARARLKATS